MDVILNGEIYVKRGPEPFHMGDIDNGKIKDLEFKSYTAGLSGVENEHLEMLKSFKSIEGEPDYSGCSDFWISYINKSGVNMVNMSFPSTYYKTYNNIEEIKKKYMKLVDFLNDAEYIGRYFRRTSKRLTTSGRDDISYMGTSSQTLALYKKDNMLLVKSISPFLEDEFEMLLPQYLEDGQYSFYGKCNDSYTDKKELYSLIHEQLIGKNKRKSR